MNFTVLFLENTEMNRELDIAVTSNQRARENESVLNYAHNLIK